ncbi:VWA domain-containing protein [Leptothoe kymatousa]|uniref:VWA domain-containing protein n=1 Tax=Leptothoe kymatousa TAU-MAC 1615 TaxID=2364775 RepID=A0ABS5Y0C5_9CYAN|nr:VWA domain-containing protein [Leptothoe kymatousa]MBT9311284.1 VWA domain-containing protein [Leptothoe kymatousa TAU-MAC 1615]
MVNRLKRLLPVVSGTLTLVLAGCGGGGNFADSGNGFEVKLLVGSALHHFCDEAAAQFNQTNPKLDSGEAFYMGCEAAGSGDVVERTVNLAQQLQQGAITPEAPEFPTIVSVDGEIYQNQLIYRMDQLYPGQNYIPAITDAPLLATSPMVFMVPSDLAPGLRNVDDLFSQLVTAKTHQDLDSSSPAQPVYYVHTAPTRSNSGLQTLVSQFASVSGKRPEDLTLDDVKQHQAAVQQIQTKITRYGKSTSTLAKSMVENGPFWASIGSVYESSVIAANTELPPGGTRYEAVYPKSTFTSNMRAIVPNAPWVNDQEKAAADQIVDYLQSPPAQAIATNLGLRPGAPGVALGSKFSSSFGVDPQASYDSYRPPAPEVAEAMLTTWSQVAKKSSLVVVVVDTSGSMEGNKLPSVQNTLKTYIDGLGPKDQVALIDFDSDIRQPVLVDGTPEGKARGLQFVASLQADGGTRLYDSALAARNWLSENLRANAINAVLILTDGEDSESGIGLDQLGQELSKSGFSSDQRIAFFTVGYGKEGDFNPQALEQIAQLNGGYYRKGDPATIAQLMADLQVEF